MVGEARRHNWPFPLRACFENLRQLSKNEIAANVPTLWCVAGNDFGASFVSVSYTHLTLPTIYSV